MSSQVLSKSDGRLRLTFDGPEATERNWDSSTHARAYLYVPFTRFAKKVPLDEAARISSKSPSGTSKYLYTPPFLNPTVSTLEPASYSKYERFEDPGVSTRFMAP